VGINRCSEANQDAESQNYKTHSLTRLENGTNDGKNFRKHAKEPKAKTNLDVRETVRTITGRICAFARK
jgi:hypothetical protein